MEFTVSQQENGYLLRDVLRNQHLSAALLRAVKRADGFFVNGVPTFTNRRVAGGDVISFALPPEGVSYVAAQNLPLTIVYEDAHGMVLNKPAGQIVHPTRGYAHGTLANAFCGLMQRRGTQIPFRPIYRLDKGTSGLILCAMNQWAAPHLAQSAQKIYYAIVQGAMPDEGEINAPIALAKASIIKRCVAPNGKQSCTQYKTIWRENRVSLVQCILKTGRTHQIRVHMANAGHALLGDDLYGGDTTLISRPALHCGSLQFINPETKQMVSLQAPMPKDMQRLCPQEKTS